MRNQIALLLAFAAAPAFGQQSSKEEFHVVGWNNACSVAVSLYSYPSLSQDSHDVPLSCRIGTMAIKPGQEAAQTAWDLSWDPATSWSADLAQRTLKTLADAGYIRPGFTETIDAAPASAQSGLEDILHSTHTFFLRSSATWPDRSWRWHQVVYSPLGDCGLFVFTKEAPHPSHRLLLLRIYNTAARNLRSRAHVTKALLLLDEGRLDAALLEASAAVEMSPQSSQALYQHAALLCLSGSLVEAQAELAKAVALDSKLKSQAKADRNFETLFLSPAFQRIIKE